MTRLKNKLLLRDCLKFLVTNALVNENFAPQRYFSGLLLFI